ncbi:XRE family transcriptional regulator [Dyadobacter psychrotolerans]|uniref:Helix-turn-helix domain-containing protein n=1 Tax=Dyadobacter psychrotolerans TaxID=2541721 RepID=A0A4R5DYY9_9BACT|nr:helix-turn-helix domain-containing protein [Dyadobacter psychrotolerans]TDE17381.1 helix-turn-helix domain-containing protein [Dyadobacter psychrotolerans]
MATLFFHSNIRFLRERRKFSQEEISEKLDLSRNKLQALESGKTKNPSAADLVKFSEYFKISMDSLFKVDLTKLSELKIRELEAGNDVYMTGTKIRVLAITVNNDNKENVEYVPVKAKAGYRSGYSDPDFLAMLPKFSMPNLPAGTHRMFPITGDSMLPVPDGSDVIACYVDDWKQLKPGTPCIVILKGEQDFVFKLVTVSDNQLFLKSLNSVYEPFTVPVTEVLEIWQFHCYQTKEFPEPLPDLKVLAKAVRDLQEEFRDMKGKG